jgi:hypothetical protein
MSKKVAVAGKSLRTPANVLVVVVKSWVGLEAKNKG